jgi:hypothetical protein
VVHETLANLSRLPNDLIALIEGYWRGTVPNSARPPTAAIAARGVAATRAPAVHVGSCYGLLASLHALAREIGLVRADGEASRTQRLALYLVYARLAFPGSRLSAARASEDHAVREILQVGRFDENDLYAALNYLAEHQRAIETALAPNRSRAQCFSTT